MRREHGISLIEVSIVVAILGIVAAVAFPNFASTDPQKVELAATEVAVAIRFARSKAMRTGNPHGFRQQSVQKSIRVFRTDTTTAPWTLNYDVYHPVSKKLYDIGLDAHPFAGADSLNHNGIFRGTCNQPDNVYFDSKGSPWCTDPENVLLEQFVVTLSLGPHTRVVRLDGITGRVTIQ